VRLAHPTPDRRFDTPPLAPERHPYTELLRGVATALSALATHERAVARAMELGDIDLPPGAPNAQDRAQLQAAAPLYFASELEAAGLLPTAELIAGLFASGAITQPLGPAAQLLNAFWRNRRDRLDANERNAIFARVVEDPHFERLMGALCEAVVAEADGSDMREAVTLETAALGLGEFLAQRVDAMATIAARDVVDNINTALVFLRDRLLQQAFGVASLWALVSIAGAAQGQGDASVRSHVDRGRAGQSVLLWLAAHYTEQTPQLDPNNPADVDVIGAAQRWLSARPLRSATPRAAAQAIPVAA
jgi:hypothetical protein